MYIEVDKEIRPQITFYSDVIEDKAASLELGRFVGKDVDMVKIKQAYANDFVVMYAQSWLDLRKSEVLGDRYPQEWYRKDIEDYKAWQQTKEIPLEGTPIKGWGLISPAQQESLIYMGIRTVEELSRMNEEGRSRYGIGALDLVNRAKSWLDSLKDSGKIALELAELKRQNQALQDQLDDIKSDDVPEKRKYTRKEKVDGVA